VIGASGTTTRRDRVGDPVVRAGLARDLMRRFAGRTGLTDEQTTTSDRYLWTDAFAVCNFLGLGEMDLAVRLVDQVHHTLGRYPAGDRRHGWLSGLESTAAEAHPTIAGLRIGKKLPERSPEDAFDERREWDRDGQYFHYLTKWMHALDLVALRTGEPRFNAWARELAATAHRAFVDQTGGRPGSVRRMAWKMSVDLSRPLVPSMGHHDPLDGFVTCIQLRATAAALAVLDDGPSLADEAASFASMIPADLATGDPLGIGGLLTDAWRLAQSAVSGASERSGLRDRVLDAAVAGLDAYAGSGELGLEASHRLGFRELGLAIGLAAVERLRDAGPGHGFESLERFIGLRSEIEGFWVDPASQSSPTWADHRNINEVMLATSLAPDGFLSVVSPLGDEEPS
jgi:hypothetical protein